MAYHGCLRLFATSRMLASTRPQSLGRMNASPMPRSALRGHVRGQALLRAAGCNALQGLGARLSRFIRAPRRSQSTQARAAADVEVECRRCDEATTSRRSADGAAMAPRYCRACASASSRWRLTTLPRWRVGVFALAQVGIIALWLGIAPLARRERAHNGGVQ